MGIHVNRTLNLKQISAIGFDMDYTLVRYDSYAFEQLSYDEIKKKLVKSKGYPARILELVFDYKKAIRGLVIDKPHGNVLKLSTYSKVKQAMHGLSEMDYRDQQKIYQGLTIDLNQRDRYSIVDTTFSVAYCVLYMQIVDLKDREPKLSIPDYTQIEVDLLDALDISHRDGTLKGEIRKNVKKYIQPDPDGVAILERFKKHQKKLWVITNSDYSYTKLLLDFAINPHLKDHKNWMELFDVVITHASKPRFFTDRLPFLEIDTKTGMMKNYDHPVTKGIFQGGCASSLQKSNGLSGEQILYLGDHIYGDVLQIKKTCNWRTALVIEELIAETQALRETEKLAAEIQVLMDEKIIYEKKIDEIFDREIEKGKKPEKEKIQVMFKKIETVDKKLGKLIREYSKHFNPHWGETMRSGIEPSRLAGQIEKYACIYMSKVSDFKEVSPRSYFRPHKKTLAHEFRQ